MTDTLNVTEWLEKRAEKTALIDDVLPSGLAVKRRRYVSMEKLVMTGKIPLPLLNELSGDGSGLPDQVEIDLADIFANLAKYGEMLDAVFVATIAEPVIGDITDPDADPPMLALSLFEDEIEDKIYIINQALAGVEAVRPFRKEK